MKSLVNQLLHIATGIIKDTRLAYPQLSGVDLDLKRLTLNSRTRGLGLFTLDLPHLDSVLLNGLEEGRLSLYGPLTTAVSKRIQVPRLFSGLWLRVFEKTGVLKQEPDVDAILFLRQLICLGKKVHIQCSQKRQKSAVKEYYDIEQSLVEPTLDWELDELGTVDRIRAVHFCDGVDVDLPLFPDEESRGERRLREKCQQVADIIVGKFRFFEPVSRSGDEEQEAKQSSFRHGPGAVSDRTGNFYKYEFPRWSRKLDEWFPYRECGTIASDRDTVPSNHEVSSKLIMVPKTAKSPRLIASEPTEHQWCQQTIRSFLDSEIRRLFGTDFICFRDQTLSADLVRQASHDRMLATIDLSSASDRLSCWNVERLFRRNPSVLSALHAARTRYLRENILYGSDSFIKLKKFASQGTAVTFPVQSLFFLVVALAGCHADDETVTWESINRLRDKVRVFGDDIIIPSTGYAGVTTLLHDLGLRVNREKSFVKGFFRESCGMDAYKGYDVTPVKPRVVTTDGPESRAAVVDNANNLFKKGFWHASTATESALHRGVLRRLAVVGRDVGMSGRYSFCGTNLDHLRKRWSDTLHQFERRAWIFRSKASLHKPDSHATLLQFFTAAHSPENPRECGYVARARTRDGLGWVFDPC